MKTCKRCKTIMHPGGEGSLANHKKGYCMDGVQQVSKTAGEVAAEWPQPAGIFFKGQQFNASAFLKKIQALYSLVIMESSWSDADKLEYESFAKELATRTHQRESDGSWVFRLYKGLDIVGSLSDSFFVDLNGARYLRIDCLRDD